MWFVEFMTSFSKNCGNSNAGKVIQVIHTMYRIVIHNNIWFDTLYKRYRGKWQYLDQKLIDWSTESSRTLKHIIFIYIYNRILLCNILHNGILLYARIRVQT